MSNFAFKCAKCGAVDYSNTTRSLSMKCPKCGMFNMKRRAKDDNEQAPVCSDLCEHCEYMECGDFLCNVTGDATIVDWKPFTCCCPEKRRLVK